MLAPPILALLAVYDRLELALIWMGRPYQLLLNYRLEGLRWRVSAWRAWRSHRLAYARVPAYQEHIDARGGPPPILIEGGVPSLLAVPETDKDGYFGRTTIERTVLGGRLPTHGVVVDESSGSSGKATSWVRGRIERMAAQRMLQLNVAGASRDRPGFVINALLLGPWTAGINVTTSLTDLVTIKSTGPDVDKVITTILQFGPKYRYFVMGYPPFLKRVADDDRIDWTSHQIVGGYGGEGLSEGLRDYLQTRYMRVFGSYGAADLEVGIAAESDLSIRVRRAIIEDERLRAALVRAEHGVTPLVMQYDPLAYHIETNAAGELVFTLNRPWHLSPRVRYNIHDLGHVMRMPMLRRILKDLGREDVLNGVDHNRDLPILFLYRRSDRSINYYGAVVSPDGVREALNGVEALAPFISTFKLLSYENDAHDKKMEVAVELVSGVRVPTEPAALTEQVFARLDCLNDDFRSIRTAAPKGNPPLLTLHPFGTGPFAVKREGRVKDDYL